MIEESCYKYMREIHSEILTKSESSKTPEEIHLRNQLYEALQTMKGIENKETIIFIGGDKSGKSTLINSLLGNSLVVNGSTNRQIINITKASDCAGPAITMKAYQQVRGPTVWKNNKMSSKKVLVEFPGHGKFSSTDQEKFNHLVAPVLYCSVKQAKLVLVWNATDILIGRFKEFLEQIKFLDSLFDKHLTSLIPGITIVFTQVPDVYGKQQVNMDYIMKSINQFVNSNQLVSPLAKKFLAEISSQPFRHGIFKKPTAHGPLTSRLDVSVRQSLMIGNYITFNDLAYLLFAVIPLSTSLFSQELADTVGSETFVKLDEAVAQITRGTSPSAIDDLHTAEELNAQKQRLMNYLESLREGLQTDVSIQKKIQILEALDPSLKNIVQESHLYRKLEMAKVVKNSIRLPMRRLSVIDKAMNHLLRKVYTDSEFMIQNIDLKIRIMKEVETVRALKKENEKLEKETINLMNKINNIRRNELKRRSFLSRFFRSDHMAANIVDALKFCAQPVLNKLLSISGLQYIARGIRSSVIAVTDIIERERISQLH